MTLFSQIQCEPCLKAAAPAIPALQTQPGIWPQFVALSVTCCVILDKLLLFSMTSLSQRSIGRENTPDIKDSQMTNYSNEKTQIRLTQTEKTFAYSVKPFRKKKIISALLEKQPIPKRTRGQSSSSKAAVVSWSPVVPLKGIRRAPAAFLQSGSQLCHGQRAPQWFSTGFLKRPSAQTELERKPRALAFHYKPDRNISCALGSTTVQTHWLDTSIS